MSALAIGTQRAALSERGNDLYETPPQAVSALLACESRFCETIWEPACGPGSIVGVLRRAGHDVVATDLVDYGCEDQASVRDFLMERSAPDGCGRIITNPPYKLADEFVRHARRLVPWTAMLLRLAFLESERRRDILDAGDLARVHIFRKRLPMMHRHGWGGPKTGSGMAFAWFVWDRAHRGAPIINRISWEQTGLTKMGVERTDESHGR